MAEITFETAVAFAPQTAEGTYNAGLDAIAATLAAADGLLLGDPESGEEGTGLDFSLERIFADKGAAAGGFTRPVSNILRVEPDFTFSIPFCGNRGTAANPPVDADATPITGVDALLQGCGLVGAAWAGGVGWRYVFGSPNPISALVYYSGNRLELLDCRCNLTLSFPPGELATLTAGISVGSIKEHTEANLPTLTYGNQQTVSAPVVESVANAWGSTRSFETMEVALDTEVETTPDSNKAGGTRKRVTDRLVNLSALLYADNATNRIFDYTQLNASVDATLAQISFQLGASMVALGAVKAAQVVIPKLELHTSAVRKLGDKFGTEVSARARNSVVNSELELIFR